MAVKFATIDVRQVLAAAGGLTDSSRIARLRHELTTQGRETTEQVRVTVVELVQRTFLRNDKLPDTVSGEIGSAVNDDEHPGRVSDHHVVVDAIRAAVDELAALGRAHQDQTEVMLRLAAERELTALSVLTQSVADVAALSRTQHNELHEALRVAVEQQLHTLNLVVDAVEQIAISYGERRELLHALTESEERDEPQIQNAAAANAEPSVPPAPEPITFRSPTTTQTPNQQHP